MSSGEIFGYIASALVFATFYMKTMMPLRLVAIASNVAFITYATIDGLAPIFILHVALLPLNVLRLLQLRDLAQQVERAAREDFSIQAIAPLMRRRVVRANEMLFRIGDPADELYYVIDGILFLPELQQEIVAGNFLGEFALFSDSGRRTATAVARTDCTLMALSRGAVFAALLQHPRLGIHLLKLITVRLLQNSERDARLPVAAAGMVVPLADPSENPPANRPAKDPGRPHGLFATRARRNAVRLAIAAFLVVMLGVAAYDPLYSVLSRNAAVTTWLNVATAPIDGTVEGFDARPGQRVSGSGEVGRIVNHSADRSGVIRAEGAAARAKAHLAELTAYDTRVETLTKEWQDRRTRYADGFRTDLDLKVEELQHRVALLQERVALAEVTARRKHTLRLAGNGSQADEDTATSTQRQLQASLTDTTKELERVRERRKLAQAGVYLQADGKEPEWSWRSLDEIRLEAARSARSLSEAEDEVKTTQRLLAGEEKNLAAASSATLKVPDGMTIWSISATNGSSVKRGERLFTWIDCAQLLVDVPVSETLAVLADEGTRAEVTLEGEQTPRTGEVLLSRGSTSRVTKAELISVSGSSTRKTSAQVIVALSDPVAGCPIGRRAFVTFPDISLFQVVRAYLSLL
ncbi:MAG: cyclic nucleotide-binding domain-containing protein [Proteobacteria bacterium]|nr:cyclic nucleotide-binding domain-containing protein [Pseudomonadota bacterium]